MSSMAAPVVPMIEASIAPMPRNAVLTAGFALRSPVIRMPPVTANRPPSSMMNGM